MDDAAAARATPEHVHLEDTTPWVRRWLRAEGVAAFLGGISLWLILDQPLPLFVVLLFVPDVSMLGYLMGAHAGAIAYNVAHNWATAGALLLLGFFAEASVLLVAGTVLLAHVGIDRALGYGLKYPTGFADTHLGRIGRRR
jgi:hypothetical protein